MDFLRSPEHRPYIIGLKDVLNGAYNPDIDKIRLKCYNIYLENGGIIDFERNFYGIMILLTAQEIENNKANNNNTNPSKLRTFLEHQIELAELN